MVDWGIYDVQVTIGERSYTVPLTVVPGQPDGGSIETDLAPLGDNLQWVAHFDNETKKWSVYDPSGAFTLEALAVPSFVVPSSAVEIGQLTDLVHGELYFLAVARDVTVQLGGSSRELTAGVNTVNW